MLKTKFKFVIISLKLLFKNQYILIMFQVFQKMLLIFKNKRLSTVYEYLDYSL